MFRWVVLSSLFAFIQSAAILPRINETIPDGRIVGGFLIDITDVPYQVSLHDDIGHFCGGTLVSPRYIISAAHCTVDKVAEDIAARIGSNRHYEGGIVIPVETIIDHPLYDDDTKDYDITIIILMGDQTWTTKFAKLPTPTSQLEDGVWCTVSGWGATNNPAESTDLLRAVYVPIVNHDDCDEMYDEYGGITEHMLCAGDPDDGGIDSCQGDSGGPLTLNGNLIGVVSWGAGCGDVGYPGVYTLVSSVREWITDNIHM